MPLLKSGKLLLAASVILLSSCRSSTPPKIEVCLGNGFGGADCILKDGARKERLPSELQNYWMTNQDDIAAFSAWCYDTSLKNATQGVANMKADLRANP